MHKKKKKKYFLFLNYSLYRFSSTNDHSHRDLHLLPSLINSFFLTREAVVLDDGPYDGGAVGQEDPPVLDVVGPAAVDLHAGGRPAGPGSGAEALDVVVALEGEAVVAGEGGLAADAQGGQHHGAVGRRVQGGAEGLGAVGGLRAPAAVRLAAATLEA